MLTHLLIIPDGNRRYALKNNLPLEEVYNYAIGGLTTRILKHLFSDIGIGEISLFGLSSNNVKHRKVTDLVYLYKAQMNAFNIWMKEDYFFKNIKIKFVGALSLLPKNYLDLITSLEEKTRKNKEKKLNVLVAYDGQEEILNALSKINNIKGKLSVKRFYDFLDIKTPIDLVLRTSGEMRLSGAPLFQTAQAEFIFSKYYFPELNEKKIDLLIKKFEFRNRRFGK